MLINDGDLKIKVVRYFERLPLSYDGEIAIVQCASDATRDRAEGQTNDSGWVVIDRFVAIGTRNAGEVLDKARERVLAQDAKILVWNHGMVLSASFDGCASFRSWDARDLPDELTVPAQLPAYCKPAGQVDCRPRDFRFTGDRMPAFKGLRVSRSGDIAFEVRSTAFRSGRPLRVSSRDFGHSWKLENS